MSKKIDDAMYRGPSHKDGGIPVVVDGSAKVEVEGLEYLICNEALNSDKKLSFYHATNKEILDYIYKDFSCQFNQNKANTGEFILCKIVVLDATPRDRRGTVKEILNAMQQEKGCKVEPGPSSKLEMGGEILKSSLPGVIRFRSHRKKSEGGDIGGYKRLLSLFDFSGQWSGPFWEAGWDVIQWDIKLSEFMDLNLIDSAEEALELFEDIDGIIAAPPCTDFTNSGAQWWSFKDEDGRTQKSIDLVNQVMKLVDLYAPTDPDYDGVWFWAIENPVGRMGKLVGIPEKPWYFHPYEFAGWLNPSEEDLNKLAELRKKDKGFTMEEAQFVQKMNAYTKKTGLWGQYAIPEKKPIEPIYAVMGGQRTSPMFAITGGKGAKTKELRSDTPEGFAKAFFEANKNYQAQMQEGYWDEDEYVEPDNLESEENEMEAEPETVIFLPKDKLEAAQKLYSGQSISDKGTAKGIFSFNGHEYVITGSASGGSDGALEVWGNEVIDSDKYTGNEEPAQRGYAYTKVSYKGRKLIMLPPKIVFQSEKAPDIRQAKPGDRVIFTDRAGKEHDVNFRGFNGTNKAVIVGQRGSGIDQMEVEVNQLKPVTPKTVRTWEELLAEKPEGRKRVVNKGLNFIKKASRVIGFNYAALSSGNVVEVWCIFDNGEKAYEEIEKYETYAQAKERAYELNNALLTTEQKELLERYRLLFVEAFEYYYEFQKETGNKNLVQAGYDYAIDKLQKAHGLTETQVKWLHNTIIYMGEGIPKDPKHFMIHMVRWFALDKAPKFGAEDNEPVEIKREQLITESGPEILNTRLKIIDKMLAKDADNSILKTRRKIVLAMIKGQAENKGDAYRQYQKDDMFFVAKALPSGKIQETKFFSQKDADDYIEADIEAEKIDASKIKLKEYKSKFRQNPDAEWLKGEYHDGIYTHTAGVALDLYPNREDAVLQIKWLIAYDLIKQRRKDNQMQSGGPVAHDSIDFTEKINERLPLAKELVDGRSIRSHVPNRASIGASLGDGYEILTGIREVPFTEFPEMGDLTYYDAFEKQRTQKLAAEIEESGELNPLIVVYDRRGAYVLEGGHRFDALRELKAKSFPALVVIDVEDFKKMESGGTFKPSFEMWFIGSKVVDKNGEPLIVYRGEHGPNAGKIETQLPVISFGSKTAAKFYAENPNDRSMHASNPTVIAAYLSIKNPVINNPDDPFIEFEDIIKAVGLENAKTIAIGMGPYIVGTNNWDENFSEEYDSVKELITKKPERLKELYVDAYPVFDKPEYVAMFKKAGYDGLIQGGNGETAGETEYKVFDKSQIWIIQPGKKKENGGKVESPQVEKYAYQKGDKVLYLLTSIPLMRATIEYPGYIMDGKQFWVTNKGYAAESNMVPDVLSAKKESSGAGYKAFKGLGGGKYYKVIFNDGRSFSSYKNNRNDAIEEAVRHRLRVKDYPETKFIQPDNENSEKETLTDQEVERINNIDFSKMDVYVDPKMIIPDNALPEKTDDFDWNALYEEAAKDTAVRDTRLDIDEERETAYQKSGFSKKWAATYKEALEKLTKQYSDAAAKKQEWESKVYKPNKKTVEVGARHTEYGESVSIGAINEGRKRRVIQSSEIEMKEALEDLRRLGLTNDEIEKIIQDVKPVQVSGLPLRVTPNKAGRDQVQKYGIDIEPAKKHEPSNVILEQKYKLSEDSELGGFHTFELFFILKSKIDQQKPFAVAYFGDSRANRYEYASASNDIDELIQTLKDYDMGEAIVEVYQPVTKEVSASVIYPLNETYSNESVGLIQKESVPESVPGSDLAILNTRLKIIDKKIISEPDNMIWKTRKKVIEGMIKSQLKKAVEKIDRLKDLLERVTGRDKDKKGTADMSEDDLILLYNYFKSKGLPTSDEEAQAMYGEKLENGGGVKKVNILNNTDSPYDRQARYILGEYLAGQKKNIYQKLIEFIRVSGQRFNDYETVFYLNPADHHKVLPEWNVSKINYHKTADQAWKEALVNDDEYPNFIRIQAKNGTTTYSVAPEFGLFADYEGDPYDGFGHLKQEVKDRAIKELKKALSVNEMATGGAIQLLAPNGKPSNLTAEQWHLVRTPAFKAWFGDWETDPQNASKMVDENGEPVVCYHGTNRQFFEFGKNVGRAHDRGFYGDGFYFTFQRDSNMQKYAKGEASYYGNIIIPVFINTRKPFNFEELSMYRGKKIGYIGTESFVFLYNLAKRFPKLGNQIFLSKKGAYNHETHENGKPSYVPISVLPALIDKYKSKLKTYVIRDGEKTFINGYVKSEMVEYDFTKYGGKKGISEEYENLNTHGGYRENEQSVEELEALFIEAAIEKYDGLSTDYYPEGYMTRYPVITESIKENHDGIVQSEYGDEVVVFEPNQIKLADGSNTTFDSKSPDIRFEDGGEIEKQLRNEGFDIGDGIIIKSEYDGPGVTGGLVRNFRFYKDGKQIGYLHTSRAESYFKDKVRFPFEIKHNDFVVEGDNLEKAVKVLDPTMRRKGLGTKMYQAALEYLTKQIPDARLLSSSQVGQSVDSSSLWKKLYKEGKAKIIGKEIDDDLKEGDDVGDSAFFNFYKTGVIWDGNIYELTGNDQIKCENCGWSWKKSESDTNDVYTCHKCGYNNAPYLLASDGKPLTVFHGSTKAFEKFKPQGYHNFFYFAASRDWVKKFAQKEPNAFGNEFIIKPYHLRMHNILDLGSEDLDYPGWLALLKSKGVNLPKSREDAWLKHAEEGRCAMTNWKFPIIQAWQLFRFDTGEFHKAVTDAGYDGIKMLDKWRGKNIDRTVYVALDANQIEPAKGRAIQVKHEKGGEIVGIDGPIGYNKVLESLEMISVSKLKKFLLDNEMTRYSDSDKIYEDLNQLAFKLGEAYNELTNTFTIYRHMFVNDKFIEDLEAGKINKLGKYWSFIKEKAESWDASDIINNKNSILISGSVNYSDVNFYDTAELHLIFNGTFYEAEIKLNPGAIIKSISLYKEITPGIYEKQSLNSNNDYSMSSGGSISAKREEGGPADFGKVVSASSRFRPYETIVFDPPLVGPNGTKLTSYTWSYEWVEEPNREGEFVPKRKSDWTQAEVSADTGRGIVHQYTVQLPDGENRTVSSDSVPILLGYLDRKSPGAFPNLATAAKTLAKQQMQLAIMEAQLKEYEELKAKFEKDPKPEIIEIEEPVEFVKEHYRNGAHNVYAMGDVWVRQDNERVYGPEKTTFRKLNGPNYQTKEQLTYEWIYKRIAEAGGKYPNGIRDLKSRIDRQKRRVTQILEHNAIK